MDAGLPISLSFRSDFEWINCRRIASGLHKRIKEHTRIALYPGTWAGLTGVQSSKSWLRVRVGKNSRELGNTGGALDCNLDRRVETLMISCAAKSVLPLLSGNVINSRSNGVTRFQWSCLSGVEFITYGRIIMDTGVNDTSIYTTGADV